MKRVRNRIGNMKEIIFIIMTTILMLTVILSVNLMKVNAQVNSTQYDMKSVTDNINKSLAKLVGGNSSGLLKNTIASINKTASQLANESKGIVNENSLSTAAIIAKKIGIGIADVLSNISGEVKQGIESK
jgi:uncharacterized membrane protein affecting hemolysin expression